MKWNPNISSLIIDNFDDIFIYFSYQNTSNVWEQKGPLEIAFKIVLFIPVIFLSIIGNYFIIIVIIKFKNSRNRTNLFIFNLAIADLFSTITFALTGLINNIYQNYVLGPVFCKAESSIKGIYALFMFN